MPFWLTAVVSATIIDSQRNVGVAVKAFDFQKGRVG